MHFGNANSVYVSEENQTALNNNFIGADVSTVSQFQKAFRVFLLQFKFKGETLYKQKIDNLKSSYEENIYSDDALSLLIDFEHLKHWRNDELPKYLQPKFKSTDYTGEGEDKNDSDDDNETSSRASSRNYDSRSIMSGNRQSMHCGDNLIKAMYQNPSKYLVSAENAIKEVYLHISGADVNASNENEMQMNRSTNENAIAESLDIGLETSEKVPYIQLEISAKVNPTNIRDLKATDIETLVVFHGIVIQASKINHKPTRLKLHCRHCHTEKYQPVAPWRQTTNIPRTCDAPKRPEESKCSLDPYVVLSNESKFCDVQNLKIQELPENVPIGDMPRHIMVNCTNALCGRVVPGSRVVIAGIFSAADKSNDNREKNSIRAAYIHALGIDSMDILSSLKNSSLTCQTEEYFRQLSRDPDILSKISKSIAPGIYGMEEIKKAIACLLFGGSRKTMPDKNLIRGDINILILGDPSTAKSQFLKFVEKCAPIAVYTSGKGSSAAGLTAAILRDSTGNFALEGGAMVLADNGVVCIDEFDKMRDDDRVAIHEAMEQQTISIAKAGITTVLNTKCSVLAAANPTFGSYDDTKETTEQHDFETTILSRFDMIWIVRDQRDIEQDKTIARHVFAAHAKGTDTMGAIIEGPIPIDKLKQYIAYCRSNCTPLLSKESAKKLENYYVEIREQCRSDSRRRRDQIPITVRQLESLCRISESLAKMSLSNDVEERHVDEAMHLFHLATVTTAKSNIMTEAMTPEDTKNVQRAEDAILQRLHIGSRSNKATIIRDMRNCGFEVRHVRRALLILIQRGKLQERGDGMVRRVASAE